MKYKKTMKSLLILFLISIILSNSVVSLSCDFTYSIKSNMLILHPIINGETDYKWEISNNSLVTGETDWISTDDKTDYIFIPFVRETLWVRLWARNTNLDESCTRVQKIEMFKTTPEDKRRYEEKTRGNTIEITSDKTDNFFNKLGWDLGNPIILIGIIIILVIVSVVIYIKYPREKWIYPIVKKKGK